MLLLYIKNTPVPWLPVSACPYYVRSTYLQAQSCLRESKSLRPLPIGSEWERVEVTCCLTSDRKTAGRNKIRVKLRDTRREVILKMSRGFFFLLLLKKRSDGKMLL